MIAALITAAAALQPATPASLSQLLESEGRGALDEKLKAAGMTSMGARMKVFNALTSR